jgi:hypothetical protein
MARKKKPKRRLKLPPELSHWKIAGESQILEGGDAIAEFLGSVDVRTVYNWRELGLPVKRYAGRLYALKPQLLVWIRSWSKVRSPGPKITCPFCKKKFNF